MNSKFFFTISFLLVCASGYSSTYLLSSPDGRLGVELSTGNGLEYSLSYDGKTIVSPSAISMTLSNGLSLGNAKVRRAIKSNHEGTIDATFYRKAVIQDNYSQIILDFGKYSAVFRAYDDGFAWRWSVRKLPPYNVEEEKASFVFPEDFTMFASYTHKYPKNLDSQYMDDFENVYVHKHISEWDKSHLANMPLMVESDGGVKMVITESDLLSYPGMFLYRGKGDASSLEGRFAAYPAKEELGGHNRLQQMVVEREKYIARCDGSAREFPWRIICLSSGSAAMADNDMVYRLASARIGSEDFSWVKPGKVAWDWLCAYNIRGVDFRPGINTRTYKYFIDFAADNKIEYVILDEGWAVKYAGNLFEVVPEIDLKEIVSYAERRGVGIILWAGYDAFRKDIDKVCSYYSALGVKGFKIDFLNRDDQIIADFMYRTAETAAKYKLLINFHGTSKPTGLQRRFPNVINVEGIFGMEQMRNKTLPEYDMVEFDVTVPFVRFVAGFADYTQGALRNASKENHRAVKTEPMSQGTRCRQLAEYVIFDSPLSMLMASPTDYLMEKDCLEFISGVPTVWDETKVIDGDVAEYIVLARRKGDVWYVGAMTDWTERDLEIDLAGIAGGPVHVDSYVDGMAAEKFANDFRRLKYDASGKIKVHLAPGGGFAAKFMLK